MWRHERLAQIVSAKNKCFAKVGADNIKVIIDAFCAMDSHDSQSHYLINSISAKPVKRCRVKDNESRCKTTNEFSVQFLNNNIAVCQNALLTPTTLDDSKQKN